MVQGQDKADPFRMGALVVCLRLPVFMSMLTCVFQGVCVCVNSRL